MGRALLLFVLGSVFCLCLAGGEALAQQPAAPSDEPGVVTTVVLRANQFPAAARVIRLRCKEEDTQGAPYFLMPGAPPAAGQALSLAHKCIALLPQMMFPIPPAYMQGNRISVAFPDKEQASADDTLPLAYLVGLYAALSKAPLLAGVAVVGALRPDGSLAKVSNFDLLAQAAAQARIPTLVAPADNLEDWNALPAEVRLGLRVVLVRNTAAALWHVLGPYGPYGQAYNAAAEAYRSAVNLALSERYQEAQQALAALAAQMPEDTSLRVWLQFVQGRQRLLQLQGHLQRAREALEAGDLEVARQAIDQALSLDPNSQEARSLKEQTLLCMNDFTPPEVWVSLEEGSEVSGTVPITVKGKDDYRLVKLSLFVDGEPLAEWATSPGQVSLDTTSLAPGRHVLTLEGRDVAGNVSRREVVFSVVSTAE